MKAKTFLRFIRVEHVVKNILWFIIGVLLTMQFGIDLLTTCIAFTSYISIWFFAYSLNECSDYEEDKSHPLKSKRPIASGEMTLEEGKRILPILLTISLVLALFVNLTFLVVILSALVLILLYNNQSWKLRKRMVFAVPIIWLMEITRLLAGSVQNGHMPGEWFLLLGLPTTYIFGFHFYWEDAKRFGKSIKISQVALFIAAALLMGLWYFNLTFTPQLIAISIGCAAVGAVGLFLIRKMPFDKKVIYYQYHFLYLLLGSVILLLLS